MMCECGNSCSLSVSKEAVDRRRELDRDAGFVVGTGGPHFARHPDCNIGDGDILVEKGDGFAIVRRKAI